MRYSTNQQVDDFLIELEMTDQKHFRILYDLRNIIFNLHPEIQERKMYGGLIFFLNQEMLCGLFAYKNHVSLEFSNGYLMLDPDNNLIGSGKYRRHLKFFDGDELISKRARYYLQQMK